MKLSTLLKGAVFAASFVALASEASAQLPVRTRQLQLFGTTSGTLTQQAAATTTNYTITWPAAATAASDSAMLITSGNGTLEWFDIPAGERIITGDGTNGQVAYFDGSNSITSSPNFSYSGGGGATLGSSTTAGSLALSDGSANTGTFQTATLAADRTYTFPDASGNVPVSTNLGTAGQILIANNDGTATWTTSDVATFRTGSATIAAGASTATITVAGLPGTATLKSFTANIVDADGTILYVTAAAIATGTLTADVATTIPVGTGGRTVYYMFTYNP